MAVPRCPSGSPWSPTCRARTRCRRRRPGTRAVRRPRLAAPSASPAASKLVSPGSPSTSTNRRCGRPPAAAPAVGRNGADTTRPTARVVEEEAVVVLGEHRGDRYGHRTEPHRAPEEEQERRRVGEDEQDALLGLDAPGRKCRGGACHAVGDVGASRRRTRRRVDVEDAVARGRRRCDDETLDRIGAARSGSGGHAGPSSPRPGRRASTAANRFADPERGLCQADAVSGVTEIDAVTAANTEFYAAFEARDLDRMAEVWERSDRATVTHPGWPTLHGWARVAASWEAIFANTAVHPVRAHRRVRHRRRRCRLGDPRREHPAVDDGARRRWRRRREQRRRLGPLGLADRDDERVHARARRVAARDPPRLARRRLTARYPSCLPELPT